MIVQRAGSYLCLVDLGRKGMEQLGVPRGGAMDTTSHLSANSMLGIDPSSPTVELFEAGHIFLFEESMSIALSGAIAKISLDDTIGITPQILDVRAGSQLRINQFIQGSRVYMAFSRKMNRKPVLNSFSPLNGYENQSLSAGSKISFDTAHPRTTTHSRLRSSTPQSQPTQCLQGPEWNLLSQSQQKVILNQDHIISPANSRMGYRLVIHPKLRHQHSMLSSPVLPGTVQLTPDGALIILMRDCQTTGGYPRMMILDEASINQIAQRSAGDRVTFRIEEICETPF
ncbi:MAG: biotin-dependent carboxyltransferase family protein [Bacteroidota bacterium]